QWGYNDRGSFWGGYKRNGEWVGRSYYPNLRTMPPQPPPPPPGLFQPLRWSDNPPPPPEFFLGGRGDLSSSLERSSHTARGGFCLDCWPIVCWVVVLSDRANGRISH